MFPVLYRGDIFSAQLNPGLGSEQCGSRPVLILQNNTGNRYSSTVIIAAITSKKRTTELFPTHYTITAAAGLNRPSIVMLEQIRTIDKQRLKNYIGHLNSSDMSKIDQILLLSLGITNTPIQST